MSVKLRLQPRGKKKQKIYDIVVADSRAPRNGRIIEKIGQYSTFGPASMADVDSDRAINWLMSGAKPTDTVRTILRHKGVLYKIHLLNGVYKGAFDFDEAGRRFDEWFEKKQAKLDESIEYFVENELAKPGTQAWRNLDQFQRENIKKGIDKISIPIVPINGTVKSVVKGRLLGDYSFNIKRARKREMQETPYNLGVKIFLDNEEENILITNRAYTLTVDVSIEDKLNRIDLLENFLVLVHINKTEMLGNSYRKIDFNEEKKGSAEFTIVPKETGETIFNIDFLQERVLIKSIDLPFKIS